MVLVGTGAGVAYAPAGMTHYALEDLALAASLPNLTVFSPCDPVETKAVVRFALDSSGPVYIRLTKSGEPVLHPRDEMEVRAPVQLSDGNGVAVLFHGAIGGEVVAAAQRLREEGIFPRVISVPCVQPLDEERLLELCSDVDHVMSVEEHFTGSGLGSRLASIYAARRPSWTLHRAGSPIVSCTR